MLMSSLRYPFVTAWIHTFFYYRRVNGCYRLWYKITFLWRCEISTIL